MHDTANSFFWDHLLQRHFRIFIVLILLLNAVSSAHGQETVPVTDIEESLANENTPPLTGEDTRAEPLQPLQDQVIATYQQNRQDFERRKLNITEEVTAEQKALEEKIRLLQKEIDTGNAYLQETEKLQQSELPKEMSEEFQSIKEKQSSYQTFLALLQGINGVAAVVLSPWALLAGPNAEKILFVFLPITVLNIFLYIYFWQKASFNRQKWLLIMVLVAVIVACATSLIAAPVDKRQEVEMKLRQAEDMLLLTGNLKAIAILENKAGSPINLPYELSAGDSKLLIYKQVGVDSAEYFMTLAALYAAENRTGKAIEALTAIAEKKGGSITPSDQIIIAMIHFLVKEGYLNLAESAVTNHSALIDNSKTLLELSEFLKENNMQTSSDHVMTIVEKKTKSAVGLVDLAEYFHAADKVDKALSLLDQALKIAANISELNLVGKASITLGASDVSNKIAERAKGLKGSSEEFLIMAKIFHDHGESTEVGESLQRAIAVANLYEELKQIVMKAVEFKQGGVMDNVRGKVIALTLDLSWDLPGERFKDTYTQCLSFIDFLIDQNRLEDASKLFEDVIKKIRSEKNKDEPYVPEMIKIARDALHRDFKKQAADIVLELTFANPREKAYEMFLNLQDDFLQSLADVPDRDLISIPLFHGLINEDINNLNDAERVYMQAVIFSLNTVNSSYGDHLPETLNEYYLLGRLWQNENRVDTLASLDRVYSLLEEKMLVALREKERQKMLADGLVHLAKLEKQRQEQLASIDRHDTKLAERRAEFSREREELIARAEVELDTQRADLNHLAVKVLVKGLATIVIQQILIGLLVACVFLAWQYSQRMQDHKTYGFLTRWVELNGWLRVFSLLDLLFGLCLIFVSQLFQIIQKIHELGVQRVPFARYALQDKQNKYVFWDSDRPASADKKWKGDGA